jgi:hypothetical protein
VLAGTEDARRLSPSIGGRQTSPASSSVQSYKRLGLAGGKDVAKQLQNVVRAPWPPAGRTARIVAEWRQQEARETLKEIARQEGLDWLVREVLSMVRQDA